MKPTICLASKSKSRRNALDGAHVRFETLPSSIPEIYEGEVVDEYVAKLARLKGEDVIDKTSAELVVSADSVTVLDDEIIEKPKDEVEAIEILQKLQGRTHIFYTGLYVANPKTKQVLSRIITTRVTLSSLTIKLIKDYVERFQPFTFAGGYDNSISSWFIDRIDGSISNLMGLPMTDLREMVEELGFNWFQFIKASQ
ncbi:MAG: Maf family protein [Candidatus Kariarchaeaceae archaeon]|jgi:septum formation protein